MKNIKYMWKIDETGTQNSIGPFTSRLKALNAIELYSKLQGGYEIITSMKTLRSRSRKDESSFVRIRKGGDTFLLYLGKVSVNNGTSLLYIGRM